MDGTRKQARRRLDAFAHVIGADPHSLNGLQTIEAELKKRVIDNHGPDWAVPYEELLACQSRMRWLRRLSKLKRLFKLARAG